MTLENELIQKIFYKKFISKEEQTDRVQVLAEASLDELKNELPDLSYIRFSQGEIYYNYKDFEAAIFKWENIHNELQPWARKNIADSYFELGMLQEAEEIYLSIDADNLTLKTEVSLQLFSLYMEQEQLDKSVEVIKETVAINPDYPNVTAIARSFFEEYRDYSNVIELTVNEALRTENLDWFDALNTYVNKRLTKTIEPVFFNEILSKLAQMDQKRFVRLTLSFWKNYQNGPFFFEWINQVNQLFSTIEVLQSEGWQDLSKQLQETYFQLIDGTYYISEIADVIPSLLTNWLKITDTKAVTAAALLAWEEIFPSKLSHVVLNDAKNIINQLEMETGELQQSLELYQSIVKWAENHEIEVGKQIKWMIEQIVDTDVNHLLIAGSAGNGKSSFINSILGTSILEASYSTIVIQDHLELEIKKITDSSEELGLTLEDFQSITALRRQPHLIDLKFPSIYLRENALAFIHTPTLIGDREGKESYLIDLADSVLFVLSANTPFLDEECQVIMNLKQQEPNLPIHFILNKIDVLNEQESTRILEETEARIHCYFPDAKVVAYSSTLSKPHQKDLSELKLILPTRKKEQSKNKKILLFIRKTITYLLQKRLDLENELIESIHWNKEAVTKLNGAIHQLSDLEKEKIQIIKESYQAVKNEMKSNLQKAIPELLRQCSNYVTETSDFRKLHVELNKEMNKQIQSYIRDSLLPSFSNSIQQWLEVSNVEFIRSQSYLKEMCEGFNGLYRKERFKFNCDFRILDDWYRDIDRMANGISLDEVNVLLRLTPSQLLLKSSGKLFGVLPMTNSMLFTMYKKFIENEKYEQVTETIVKQFMMQFELFERGLERDISMSFREPFSVIDEAIKEAELQIDDKHKSLNKLKSNPEVYVDPLTLFKVKLRQYELLANSKKTLHPVG
ncbi:GTPase domain-containing protein [Alkalihalobacillus deserti]|uniref:GTPase domain-containing protein n=1 Tax=Alkalihalobacillus deserti TaxID=2879466 RepID=UPI001D154C35|nr:GTPase domain-containing protein [Alkalihalobacillus deserti]